MYTAQLTIERIQSLIKKRGLVQKDVLAECGMGKDTLKRMTDNKGISSFSLAKIADCLECSTDYLLGRTDNPGNNNNIKTGDNNGQNNNSSVTINSKIHEFDETTTQVAAAFQKLDFAEKTKVMSLIAELSEKEK